MSNGIILYKGPSLLDGKPIVAIATGLQSGSINRKTGSVVQTWIIREDVKPHLALKSGDDASVCGDCKHRPANNGACYVQVAWAPLAVYNAYVKGGYTEEDVVAAGRNKGIRIGSYGDPAAVPISIWKAFSKESSFVLGYTHQWKICDPELKTLCMASVDSEQEAEEATRMGWRYFRVKRTDSPRNKELVCPASEEKGKVLTCEKCKACGGLSSKSTSNVVINIHGVSKNKFK